MCVIIWKCGVYTNRSWIHGSHGPMIPSLLVEGLISVMDRQDLSWAKTSSLDLKIEAISLDSY